MNFEGRDVTRCPQCSGVSGVGRSFQIPQPFSNLTVYENLLVAARSAATAVGSSVDAGQCAVILERTELISRQQTAGWLSLLERKRLELARAMATHPNSCCSTRSQAG
jgi:branched-chain amino acid transport system ATP-binding protein